MYSPGHVAVVAVSTVPVHSVAWVLLSVAIVVSHLEVSSILHSASYQSEAWIQRLVFRESYGCALQVCGDHASPSHSILQYTLL